MRASQRRRFRSLLITSKESLALLELVKMIISNLYLNNETDMCRSVPLKSAIKYLYNYENIKKQILS